VTYEINTLKNTKLKRARNCISWEFTPRSSWKYSCEFQYKISDYAHRTRSL